MLYGYKSDAVDQKNGLRPQSTTLRVMSFNILSDFDDYSTAGKDRITAVQQEIYFYSPDIIGVQEDYSEVLSSFSLDGYKKISPSSLSSGSSNCSIFYKSGITLKTSGSKYVTSDGTTNTVALTASDVISGKYKLTSSELSELGITSSTNMRTIKTSTGGSMLGPKRITWGVFEINGKTVIAVNVHLQHRAQNATYSTPAVQKLRLMERLKQLELTQKQITSLKNTYPTAEVVITGDFNDLVGTDTYLYLRDTYQYSSAHETAVLKYGVSGTWNNAFSSDTQGAVGLTTLAKDRSSASMLDFCFVSSGIKTLKFRVGAGLASVGAKEKVYTSDHLPIVADLYIGSSVPASLTAPPSVYSGTPDTSWYKEGTTSYTLTTADQLMGINELRDSSSGEITFEGVTIKLGADMIINQGSLEEIIARGSANKAWKAVNSAYNFKGTFDGQGHSISGVYLSATNSNRGMFGGVAGNATIKNFVLENSYFCGSTTENKSSFGCIVALINDSSANVKLTDITVSDSVKMQETTYAMKFIGGFVGKVESGTLTMTNCHFNGTIDFANSTYATAFVGMTNSATLILNNCHGDGYVKCYNYIAGLSGYTDNTTKTNNDSCFTGTLKATKATDTNSNASFIK